MRDDIKRDRGNSTNNNYLNTTLSTGKKKTIRKQIMNSSYISGSIGNGSVTSQDRQKRKKSLVEAAERRTKDDSIRNSY